jgi:four helix bundle protein
MSREALPLIALWEQVVGEVLDRTRSFPKHARFTFASRIDRLGLDILERLVEARYAPRRETPSHLRAADSALTRLRVLLRLSTDRSFLSLGAYEHLSRRMDEAGRMLGGWRKAAA